MVLAHNQTLVALTRHSIPRDGRFAENYPSATGNMKSFSEQRYECAVNNDSSVVNALADPFHS
jgi:hypothetical protein